MDYSYRKQLRLLYALAAIVSIIWFGWQVINILLIFFLAVVLTIVLNAPTMWLISKGIPRIGAALIVFFSMLLFLCFIGWLVIPKIIEQLAQLIQNLPQYSKSLNQKLSSALSEYPSLRDKLAVDQVADNIPSTSSIVKKIGNFSLSVFSTLFFLILFFSIIAYMLINPRPLVETYLEFFSEAKRDKATNALANASTMLIGWMKSNIIVGSIEAVSVWIFLSLMNVPGIWVWAGLAIFAELIPKIGFYIMAIPPTLIALSIDPMVAVWVILFYVAMNELLGDFVMPRIRASTMQLHPVFTIFVMLVMTTAFGLMGALISTPFAAFIKAFYQEFFQSQKQVTKANERIQSILERRAIER